MRFALVFFKVNLAEAFRANGLTYVDFKVNENNLRITFDTLMQVKEPMYEDRIHVCQMAYARSGKFGYLNLIFSFLFLIPIISFSQSSFDKRKVDSLTKILPTLTGEQRFDALFGIAYEYSDVDDTVSYRFAKEAFAIAMKLGDSARIIKGGRIKQGQLRRIGKYHDAVKLGLFVYRMAKRRGDTTNLKMLSQAMISNFHFVGDFDNLLLFGFENLHLREKKGTSFELGQAYLDIGLAYAALSSHDKALEYYFKALRKFESKSGDVNLATLLSNIIIIYKAKEDYKNVELYLKRLLEECGKIKCGERMSALISQHIGDLMFFRNNFDSALHWYQRSYEHSDKSRDYLRVVEARSDLAKIYDSKNDFEKVEHYFQEAEDVCMQHNLQGKKYMLYKRRSLVYKKYGLKKKEIEYTAKFISIRDSLYNEKLLRSVDQIKSDYELVIDDQMGNGNGDAVMNGVGKMSIFERVVIFIVTTVVIILSLAFARVAKKQYSSFNRLSSIKQKILTSISRGGGGGEMFQFVDWKNIFVRQPGNPVKKFTITTTDEWLEESVDKVFQ